MEDGLCEYGCSEVGLYILKNGKRCCNNHYNKCPAIRKKNSNGLKRAHQAGKIHTNLKINAVVAIDQKHLPKYQKEKNTLKKLLPGSGITLSYMTYSQQIKIAIGDTDLK